MTIVFSESHNITAIYPPFFIPDWVARVPVSLWGSGGWRCVRSMLRNRSQPVATIGNHPQPSTTIRNRPQPFAWGLHGRAYGKFCKRGDFWMLPASRTFVSRGRPGTSWHSDMFRNVSKIVFVWQAWYFCDVFRRCVAFFIAGAAIWQPPCVFPVAAICWSLLAWRRHPFAAVVNCCVPCCFPRVVSTLVFLLLGLGQLRPRCGPVPPGCVGLLQQSTALACASLDLARLLTVLFLSIMFPFVGFHLLVPVFVLPRLCAASFQLMALSLQT